MTDTRVAIDLNVRVRGDQTYAGFEDVEGDMPFQGARVEVYERESGVFGKAEVIEIDSDRQLIFLRVNWAALVERTVLPAGAVFEPGSLTKSTEGFSSRSSLFGESQAAVTAAAR